MPETTLRERRGLGAYRTSPSSNGLAHHDSEKPGNGTDTQLKAGSDSHASHRARKHVPNGRAQPAQDKTEVSSVWFDAPLALALFPTLGTFLTGGEHVRDFLLLLVMLYYLHQLVKVPWDLYTLSRTRRRAAHEAATQDDASEESHSAKLARSELHTLSLLFLTFTVFSPLIGAYILRSATSVFLGKEALSWFSTTVFVLASGIRPWRHLVDLLRHRTLELQTTVQHADGLPNDALTFLERMDNMEQQIAQLLEANKGMKSEIAQLQKTTDQTADETEKLLRRHSRKTESDRQASNIRIEALETKFDAVVSELRSSRGVYVRRPAESVLAYFSNVAFAITSPLWGAASVREGPARGYQRSVRNRKSQHNLTRIPEEGGERDESKPELVTPAVEERDWYEFALAVAIAPVRQLRALLVFILGTVKTYLLP